MKAKRADCLEDIERVLTRAVLVDGTWEESAGGFGKFHRIELTDPEHPDARVEITANHFGGLNIFVPAPEEPADEEND